MTEKKPKSPVLVISAIIFLLIFIILPPVFRIMIPKQETSSTIKKEMFILSCEKNDSIDGYKITSKLIYEDDAPTKNTISYIKNTTVAGGNSSIQNGTDNFTTVENNGANINDSDDTEVTRTRTVAEEIEFFKTINGIKMNDSEAYTSVVITGDIVDANSNNLELMNYFSTEDEQTSYYEERGFTCIKIEL